MRTLNPIKGEQEQVYPYPAGDRYLTLFGPAASMLASRIQEGSAEAVLVASGWKGEGSTTVTLGLAHALHRSYGARVLVVELNFSSPLLAAMFGTGDDQSLEAIASGRTSVLKACTRVNGGFSVLPAGNARAVLWRSVPQVLKRVLQEAAGEFDVVLIDTPPVLDSADAAIAGKAAPHLLLVVEAGQASLESLDRVRAVLESQGVAVIGSILNKSRSYMPRWLYRRLSR
jgi:Mrp family chromosome partitioning ATPase